MNKQKVKITLEGYYEQDEDETDEQFKYYLKINTDLYDFADVKVISVDLIEE